MFDASETLSRLSYKGGIDVDAFIFRTPAASSYISPVTKVTVNLGAGNDIAQVLNGSFLSMRIDGGLDVDSVSRVAASIAAGLETVNVESVTTI